MLEHISDHFFCTQGSDSMLLEKGEDELASVIKERDVSQDWCEELEKQLAEANAGA